MDKPLPSIILLDDLSDPSGRELVTRRPAWQVRFVDGTVVWAFVEVRNGRVWITGYPMYQVECVRSIKQIAVGAVVGLLTGAFIGELLGGHLGAVIGGIIVAILTASSRDP